MSEGHPAPLGCLGAGERSLQCRDNQEGARSSLARSLGAQSCSAALRLVTGQRSRCSRAQPSGHLASALGTWLSGTGRAPIPPHHGRICEVLQLAFHIPTPAPKDLNQHVRPHCNMNHSEFIHWLSIHMTQHFLSTLSP